MKRLLIEQYYLAPLLIAAILSLRAFRLRWPSQFSAFSIYLWSYLLIEIFALAWKKKLYTLFGLPQYNVWVYNFGLIIYHALIIATYYKILTSLRIRKFLLYWGICYIPVVTILYFTLFSYSAVHEFIFVPVYACNILLSLAYFYQLLHQEELIRVEKTTETWMSLGLFIYHSLAIVFISSFNNIIYNNLKAYYYTYANKVLLTAMMLSFIIAFLCKPNSKK